RSRSIGLCIGDGTDRLHPEAAPGRRHSGPHLSIDDCVARAADLALLGDTRLATPCSRSPSAGYCRGGAAIGLWSPVLPGALFLVSNIHSVSAATRLLCVRDSLNPLTTNACDKTREYT